MSFGPELVWSWSRELSAYKGRRVQRAEGGKNSAVISLGGAVDLLLSWGAENCGAAVISGSDRKSLAASATQKAPVVNALKSHLLGAEFLGAVQLRRDRILRLSFRKTVGAGFSSTRHIILEAMERFSNILLTDGEGLIIETAKHIHPAENSFRTVLPGLAYRLPPLFDGISVEEWLASPSPESLERIAGIGRPLLRRLAECGTDEIERALRGLYDENYAGELFPQRIGKYITALPLLLKGAEAIRGVSAGELITLTPLRDDSIERRRKKITRHISKEILRRERQLEDIAKLLSDDRPELYRQYGELIVANLWNIKHNTASAELTGYDADGAELSLSVPLDPRLSPSQNSAAYFAKYKKLTAARERAAALVEEVRGELDEWREELAMASCLEEAESLAMLEEELGIAKSEPRRGRSAKKETRLPPHRRFDFENAIVYAGLSAKGNRYLTFRLASADDIWFHAQGVPGAHVILRPTAQLSDEETERMTAFCASLAAFYSKGGGSERRRVDYTKRKYVSPLRGGEANVTYRDFSTETGDPKLWKEFK
ncbi:MAG: NFACT family protein [Synergistaceae bacterium]|nr:NFACT family protein [Synergistaceae bacterium]